MIDGIWWLVILFAVTIVLWLVAKSRGSKIGEANTKQSKAPVHDGLYKTAAILKEYFPNYRVTRKAKHLLLSEQNQKIAMITMDKKIAIGQRRLGDVPVINYHRVPSRAQLTANLQDVE